MFDMNLLHDVVLDYTNPEKCYALAKEYERLDQGSAAFGFYLRAADMSEGETFEEKWLQYKAMIRSAGIFYRAKNRDHTVAGLYRMCFETLPERPEAYYFFAKWQMDRNEWREALIFAKMGLAYADAEMIVDSDIDYPGVLGLKYVYAMARWKTDGRDDSKNLLFDLKYKNKLDSNTEVHVTNLLVEIGYPSTLKWTPNMLEKTRYRFNGIENVKQNYSRHFQDMFVLAFLNGKKNGTFIELGSGHPKHFNNTLLLEDQFGWNGLSVDNNERFTMQHTRMRRTSVINANAAEIDYRALFKTNCVEHHTDFLRINAEWASLEALKRIPFDNYQFSVIQFQHNHCWWKNEYREFSRDILRKIGYILLVPDVAINEKDNYEDWWVHPGMLNNQNKDMQAPSGTNFAWSYMMKEYRV